MVSLVSLGRSVFIGVENDNYFYDKIVLFTVHGNKNLSNSSQLAIIIIICSDASQ